MKPYRLLLMVMAMTTIVIFQSKGQTGPQLEIDTVDNIDDPNTWVRTVLFGGGGQVSGVHFTGNQVRGIGRFFNGDDLDPDGGFKEGIIISNGYVRNAEGLNYSGSDWWANDTLGRFTDYDLERLLGFISGTNKPEPVTDASVLTFYFQPHYQSMTLRYIYASEEYIYYDLNHGKPDFCVVCDEDSTMVDVGAILYWNNPGNKIYGSVVNSGTPGDNLPVNVLTVNHKSSPPPRNYYRQNPEHPLDPILSTEFDAMTIPMEVMFTDIVPCLNYGFKVAVADYEYAGGYQPPGGVYYPYSNHFNTAIFLEGGSLKSGTGLEWWFELSADNNDFERYELVEGGCARMIVNLRKNQPVNDSLLVRFKIVNADTSEYTITPAPYQDSLMVIEEDDSVATYIIEAKFDGVTEGPGGIGMEKWYFRFQEDPCDVPSGGIGSSNQGYSGVDTLFVFDYNQFSTGSKNYGPDPNSIYYCGNSVTLNVTDLVSGGLPPYFYSWIQDPPGSAVGLAENFAIVISDNPDHSTCYVRDRCTDFDIYPQGEYDVYVYSTLVSQASPDFQLCENLDWPITITSTNVGDDFSVVWRFQGNIVSTEKIYVVTWDDYFSYYGVLDSLVFQYTVTDECGNTNNGEVVAFWDPIVDISGPAVICLGESITVECTQGQSYQWYWNSVSPGNLIAGATSQSYTTTPGAAGSYTLCVEIINACDQAASSCFDFEVSELICQVTLDGSNDFEVCPGTPFSLMEVNGFAEWHWSWFDDGQYQSATGQTITLSLLDPGSHTITVSAYNEFGCYDDLTFNVNVFPYTTVSTSAQYNPVCSGYPTILDAQSVVSPASYYWTALPPDPSLAGQETQQSPEVAPQVATIYTCTITDINGCSGSADIQIDIREPIEGFINQSLEFICTGDDVEISFSGTVMPSDATYTWIFENGNPSTSNNPGEIVTWDTPGSWDVQVHIVEPGCEGTFDMVVVVNPKPTALFTVNNPEGCEPVEVQFFDQSLDLQSPSYYWEFGDGGTSTEANPVHTYELAGSYDVTLTVTNGTGCDSSYTINNAVQVYQATNAVFNAEPPAATLDNPTIRFIPGMSGGTVTHTWDFGDGTSSTEDNPAHSYTSPGSFLVIHTTTNEHGCTDTDTLEIGILRELKIFIPNAFTPDGDGLNDCFGISGTVSDIVDRFSVQIFDRWGNLVYESLIQDYHCLWDGRDREGNLSAGGEFSYLIRGVDLNGRKHNFRGVVAVIL